MSDELSKPLGRKKLRDRLPALAVFSGDWPVGRLMLLALVLIGAGVAYRLVSVNEPEGGRPVAEAPIDGGRATNDVAEDVAAPATPSFTIGDEFPANDIGQVKPPDGEAEPESAEPERVGARELNAFGAYPDLVEQTQHGPVPRIGPNGLTPFEAYARASISPASAAGRPLVAIVLTGLGLGSASTADAVSKLPDNVTLGFAPYGDNLASGTAAARAEGHELWLEIPMEPFDYPNSDPGPHTLLTDRPARTNLDKLFWLMARFGGYAGVINNQGARFTSAATDFQPIMEEIGVRGLGYLDDGSSNRSLARQLAGANRVPYARSAMELDANPGRAAILDRLDELVARAAENGGAVGMISALPVSIETVAGWAANLDDDGVALVPASALMQQGTQDTR